MKILFLTPYVPSSRAGGEKFTQLLLKELSQNHQIDLVYYKYGYDGFYKEPNENVKVVKVCNNSTMVKMWNALKLFFLFPTFTIRFDFSLLFFLKRLVKERSYDLIYLDHSQMALYGCFFKKCAKVIMSHDVMCERFANHKFPIPFWVRSTEKFVFSQSKTSIWTFSEKDKALVRKTYGIESKSTSFLLDQIVIDANPERISNDFVFFGKWKRADNFDGLKFFFDEVYPKLSKSLHFVIVGIGMPDDYKQYLETLPNVEYSGFVDNPYVTIANAKALISPIFSGAGVKVKVYETLACGTPVIGNDAAFEGIDSNWEKFMLRANSVDEFVQRIENVNISLEDRKKMHDVFCKSCVENPLIHYLDCLVK